MRLKAVVLIVCFLTGPVLGEDTVAEDLGMHQLRRLVDLLTAQECEELLGILSSPEGGILQRLERLSAERHPARHQRASGHGEPCGPELMAWFVTHGKQIFYDRLFRALQHIGRTDIAKEVGKNINQDKVLAIQRYVEDYHRYVEAMKSSLLQTDGTPQQHADPQHAVRRRRDLTWRDLELAVGHERRPPYTRRPLDGALTLIYGTLLGFTSAFLAAVPVYLFVLHISQSDLHRLLRLSLKGQLRAPRRPRQPNRNLQQGGDMDRTLTQGPKGRSAVPLASHHLKGFTGLSREK